MEHTAGSILSILTYYGEDITNEQAECIWELADQLPEGEYLRLMDALRSDQDF
jgi:hypothetical protein